jgi:hypothetical protein
MADLAQGQTRSDARGVRTQNAHVPRHRPRYVLFVHRARGAIDSCLREFAVVLPETGVAATTLVARRICELLDADGEAPTLSVSLGIASYPREADAIGTLLYAADKPL